VKIHSLAAASLALVIAPVIACNINLTENKNDSSNGGANGGANADGSAEGAASNGDGTDGGSGEASSGSEGGAATDGGACMLGASFSLMNNALTLTNTTTGTNESPCISEQTKMISCYIQPGETGGPCAVAISCQSPMSDFDGNGTGTVDGTTLTGNITMTNYGGTYNGVVCTYSVTGVVVTAAN
jgi:hypothetical protein